MFLIVPMVLYVFLGSLFVIVALAISLSFVFCVSLMLASMVVGICTQGVSKQMAAPHSLGSSAWWECSPWGEF